MRLKRLIWVSFDDLTLCALFFQFACDISISIYTQEYISICQVQVDTYLQNTDRYDIGIKSLYRNLTLDQIQQGEYPYQYIGREEVKEMEWFRKDNTEGFDEKTLEEMNVEMQKLYDSLSDEEKENKSYIDYLKEQILSQF